MILLPASCVDALHGRAGDLVCFFRIVCFKTMEAIKKKLASLKGEKEAADERAEDAEAQRKEAEAKYDAVRELYV